jgi:hypothetical protein
MLFRTYTRGAMLHNKLQIGGIHEGKLSGVSRVESESVLLAQG